MTDNERLAGLLFPDITKTIADYEEEYPQRKLSEGAKVTRFAPSPTGYMHIGNMFSCLIDRLAASTPDSVFYLRIEDTDKKREVPDAIDKIIEGLSAFGIAPTEGITGKESEKGAYGPYKQSLRKDIYQSFAKELVLKGFAYPCFCTEEELSALREEQEKEGANPGYYGKYASCRNLTIDQQEEKIKAGIPYTPLYIDRQFQKSLDYMEDTYLEHSNILNNDGKRMIQEIDRRVENSHRGIDRLYINTVKENEMKCAMYRDFIDRSQKDGVTQRDVTFFVLKKLGENMHRYNSRAVSDVCGVLQEMIKQDPTISFEEYLGLEKKIKQLR